MAEVRTETCSYTEKEEDDPLSVTAGCKERPDKSSLILPRRVQLRLKPSNIWAKAAAFVKLTKTLFAQSARWPRATLPFPPHPPARTKAFGSLVAQQLPL